MTQPNDGGAGPRAPRRAADPRVSSTLPADARVGEGIEAYPGYGLLESARQNWAELAVEMADTSIGEDTVLENSSSPHQAIFAETDDLADKARHAAADARGAQAQIKASKPLEAREEERRAARDDAEADREDEAAGEIRDDADRTERQIDELPVSRRGRMGDLAEVLLTASVIIGSDVFVIVLLMQLVPGTSTMHWGTAGFLGTGLALFTSMLGWAVARTWEQLDHRAKMRTAVAGLAVLLVLFCWLVKSLQDFRVESFRHLLDADFKPQDPKFFAPMQLVLGAASTLAAFRFYLGETGRELRGRLDRQRQELMAALARGRTLRANAEQHRHAAGQAQIAEVVAIATIPTIDEKEKVAVQSIRAHGRFVRSFFDTMFLRRRHEVAPPAADLAMVAGERRFRLRRLITSALLGLAFVSLAAATGSALDQHLVFGVAALMAACAFAVLAYLSFHRPLPDDVAGWEVRNGLPDENLGGPDGPQIFIRTGTNRSAADDRNVIS